MRSTINRRQFGQLLLGTAAVGLLATGCGKDEATAADGTLTLGFAWWGNEFLNAQTNEATAAFEKANAGIKIDPRPGDWASYWDKLATVTAGKDSPDIIQMDQKYIAEYGGRGALADLSTLGVDVSGIDPQALATGQYSGKQYGLSTGQNALVVMANTAVFKEAGVELPDDLNWTWDDYTTLAARITAAGKGKLYGASYGNNESSLIIWLGQHGEQLYTDDGQPGFTTETAAKFWEQLKLQRDRQASPPASINSEDASASLENSLFGTNRLAMGWSWTNQLASLESATGSGIKMLRAPSLTGSAKDNGMYYKPTMYWAVSSQSKHPEQAASFVDYLLNSPEAGEILMTDRGIPTNGDILAAITPSLKPADALVVKFLADIKADINLAPPIPPVGASGAQEAIIRQTADVLFDKTSPQQAAEAFATELKAMLDSARK
ncbi:ABC transporter substrate-binding protein [Specibacter sp. NPDC057265]|uniref:ABC transporter substrate-binding protein n=1 Tax=Specibacter sp. NPDC057265 TaxID=3346075 RepID=UPI00363F749E